MILSSFSSILEGFGNSLNLGIIFAIMAIGVHISFRILDTADLTIEGSLPFGGCITALLIFEGVNPFIATFIAIIGGCAAGFVTGILNTKIKIPTILSGIITMSGLYSVNLLLLGITNPDVKILATLPVSNNSVFSFLSEAFSEFKFTGSYLLPYFIVGLLFLIFVFVVVYFFFGTELGMSIRSTGDNEEMSRAQGINTNFTKVLGLMISNGLIALAGSLFVQNVGVANVSDGRGMIVVALAAIIIGETIFGRKSYKRQLISIIVGTIIYYLLRAIAIELDLDFILDLVSAVLITFCLAIPMIKNSVSKKKGGKKHVRN